MALYSSSPEIRSSSVTLLSYENAVNAVGSEPAPTLSVANCLVIRCPLFDLNTIADFFTWDLDMSGTNLSYSLTLLTIP